MRTLKELMEINGFEAEDIEFLNNKAVKALKTWSSKSGVEYKMTIVIYPEWSGYTARVDKPNGKTTWWYQKSFPQIATAFKKVEQFYK